MSIHDKVGHPLSVGDCVVSVDRDNIIFIGRIDGLYKSGSLRITRLTKQNFSGTTYTVKPMAVVKFQPSLEFTAFLLKQ
jgi:hypothetical protein